MPSEVISKEVPIKSVCYFFLENLSKLVKLLQAISMISQFHEFFHSLILKTCQTVEGHKYDQSISRVFFNLISLEVPLACGGAVGSRTGGEHGREVDCWPPGLRESGPRSE